MKNLITLIFIITAMEFNHSQTRWEWITRYPTGNSATNSCQSEGRVFYLGWPKTFFYTPDGGNSFNVVTPYLPITDTQLSGNDRISFADSLHGVVIDAEGAFKTTNGGKEWRNIFPTGAYFSLVAFGSPKIGWIYGSSGFNKTTDSGNSWPYLNNSGLFEIPGSASNIFALDENNLWITKDYQYGNSGGAICFSSDGGSNWSVQNSIASDSLNRVYYRDIKINKSGIGIAAGEILIISENWHYIPFVLRTSDFGSNWEQIPVDSILTPTVIVSKDDEDWLILGSKKTDFNVSTIPVELKTTDGGYNWIYKENIFSGTYNYNKPQTAEYLQSENILLVSGYDGVHRSTNFGDTFIRISGKTELWVKGFAIDNHYSSGEQLAVAVSAESFIISEDGGRNWQKKYSNEVGLFRGPVSAADGYIFAAINSSLYKSSDKGDSWIKIFDDYVGISNISALSRNEVAFTASEGYSQFLYYTKDGGETWLRSAFYIYSNDMNIVTSGKIYASGYYYDSTSNGGYIYNSDNYGRDWHVIDTEFEMKKVRNVNSKTAIAISNYEVYRSTDSGNSWSIVLSSNDYFNYYSNFAFKDSVNGIMKISYKLFESHNAGSSWSYSNLSLPIWGELSFMEYNMFGDLIIVGDPGIVIHKSNNQSNINEKQKSAIEDFNLYQNFPNPFNPNTTIKFSVPKEEIVSLTIYNLLGEKVKELKNELMVPGYYQVEFNAASLSSGVYIYTLQAGEFIETMKMILLK